MVKDMRFGVGGWVSAGEGVCTVATAQAAGVSTGRRIVLVSVEGCSLRGGASSDKRCILTYVAGPRDTGKFKKDSQSFKAILSFRGR